MAKYEPFYVSVEDATTVREGAVMVNRWWSYQPGKGIILARMHGGYLAPQCNSSKMIAESVTRDLYPDAEVIFLSAVYTGHEYRFGGKVHNG